MKKQDVLEYFKTPTAVAKTLGVTVGAISQWDDIIPEKSAFRLNKITNGALKYDETMYRKKAS